MHFSRRHFTRSAIGATASWAAFAQAPSRPNVIVIITDDQGYGDLSCHGNPHLKTPNLDRIAAEGVEFTQFHVSPVCAPTRASLMTGRYNYRTGVVDTYLGRAMMYPDEVTIPELLRRAGYRTGIFGKWHLGDNFPLRAMDQGFEEALIHTGGGLTQPSDPPGNTYFDPVLFHNGKAEKHKGYCTDIFASAAMEYIEKNRNSPFFVYLATNAPHTPLQISETLVEPYRKMGLNDTTAKVYAMCENVDANVGRLLSRLEALNLARDTVVIFMTDNGPQQDRFNAGMRGRKGSVYQGGVRVPFFLRWPAAVKAGSKVDTPAAHIDVLPTLLELCGAKLPSGHKVDGVSLVRLLRDNKHALSERSLFFQWHRGDEPEPHRSAAVRRGRWKLVNGNELYDLQTDYNETKNLAPEKPEVVAKLRSEYDAWFRDVSSTRGYAPPRIAVGAPEENPVLLTRQDWRGPKAGWDKTSIGHWEVDVRRAGKYDVTLRFAPADTPRTAVFKLANVRAESSEPVPPGATEHVFRGLQLASGPARVEAQISGDNGTHGMNYVELRRI